MSSPEPLAPEFFAAPTLDVARRLIGVTLVYRGMRARIVETEAYTDDAASHFVTRPRTGAMLGDTWGRIYIYSIYGIHRCLNVTTDEHGPGAVLLRAVEPLTGVEAMRARRGVRRDIDLTNGPAKLFVALGIDPAEHGRPATGALGFHAPAEAPTVETGPRIGISKARDLPWRFWLSGNRHVSRSRGP